MAGGQVTSEEGGSQRLAFAPAGRFLVPSRSREASHVVAMYEDEAAYARSVGRFLAAGLTAGHGALVIATAAHRAAIASALSGLGVATELEVKAGRLRFLDARATLDAFMTPGGPDPDRFFDVVGAALRACLAAGKGPVHAHGEMVDLLCADDAVASAIELEKLWNEIAGRHAFHLLCTYAAERFERADDCAAFDAVCSHHTHVLPAARDQDVEDEAALREIARLQQRERALETELQVRRRLEGELREALAERAHAEAAVHDRERDLTDCLENAAEAIHWVGPDGIIQWANRAELELLGYPAEEYVGRHIAEFHADAAVIEDMLERLGRGDSLRDHEARLRHRDGSLRTVLVNSNVLWRDGRFVHTRCFTRDVTDARRAAEERELLLERERQAREEAEAANQAKSEFLAVMSHELRTPLNAIGGYAELIELGVRGPVTAAQREDLARIQRSQRHLLGLINEVLNYTRIESGAVSYHTAQVSLAELVGSVEVLVRPQLAAKGLALAVAPREPDGDAVARADREKLQQVLLNLLSNAVKFTGRGGRIEIAWERTVARRDGSDAAPVVLVHVRDTGIGIPAEKLDVVFEPFVQVHSGLTRSHNGTGLGLAISRDLARGMHGDLTVASIPGQGSTFTVTLPAAN